MTYPLSQTQMGIYVTCINTQEEGSYNLPMLYKLDDDVDIERLAKALDQVIEAHPYVKSRLVTNDEGEVVFEDRSEDEFHTSIFEVNDIEDVRSHLGEDYDLMNDRLFRLEIYKTIEGRGEAYLYVDFHHIIFDGMSWAVFTDDLEKAYAGETLEKETVNGFQIAEQELADRDTQTYADAKQWYAKEFGGATEVDSMPLADIYGNDEVHYSREYIKLKVDKAAIDAVCQKAGVRESMLFTAAFGFTLSKYAAEDEVLYNTAFHGRNDKQTRRSFCMMVKTLPVYHNLTSTPTVVELLRQTSDQIKASRQNAIYSYGDIATELELKSDISFAYQGTLHNLDVVLNGKKQESEDLVTNTPGIKFLNMIMVEDGAYYAWSEYQNNKYSKELILGFWATYEHILGEMCVKENLSDIEACNAEQIAQLDSFNHAVPEEEEETVLSAFQKAVQQYPDNVAAVFKEKKYTYKELDELTDKVAGVIYNKVKDCGKAEPVVSIIISRNENMFILPLAAIKAGCAYQPLDPSYPQERLNFMVKDADAALLMADDELRPIINEYEGEVILTSDLTEDKLPAEVTISSPLGELEGASLFILLYTSGSTGVPKGVMLEHRNLVAFNKFCKRYYDITSESKIAAYASFGFDANMQDVFCTLMNGATLHVIDDDIRLDLEALHQYFEREGITHSFMTTQVAVQYLENYPKSTSLKHLSMGGEKLRAVNPEELDYKIHNGYGPSETTCGCAFFHVKHWEPNIPVGTPTDTVRLYIVDKHGHRLPIGAAGELWINGAQVGRGYLNRPDKTMESFTGNPFGEGRVYHSGDIVRYRQDGNIEFVGRKDGQVKIRGFRIELKEVEAVIRDFEGIKDVTVQAFDDPNGGKFIAAYVVSDSEVDINALNSFIFDQKPPYMVPAVTMQIEKIPLNVNQKVDKKALPKPELKHTVANTDTVAAPLNALEVELKEMIAGIVNNDAFGITDILGYVGLTSISSIKLATLIYKRYGVQVNAKTLAKTGTLQSIENEILAQWMTPHSVEQTPLQQTEVSKDSLPREGRGGAPLSFTQQGVYTECMANAGSVQYNIPAMLQFPSGVTAGKLKDAVTKVIEAHPYMKCHFVTDEKGEVVQQPLGDFVLDIPTSTMTADELEQYKKDFVRPFDLAKGPLFRFEIIAPLQLPRGGEGAALLFDIHHLIGDGASVNLLNHQICQALDGEDIEKESYDYYQFVQDQVLDATADEYFDQTIGGVEEVSRLLPDIFEENLSHHQRTISVPLSTDGIAEICRKHGITPAAFFLAASALTVSRYLCEEDVTLTTISNGRSNLKISDTVGMFVNTLPLALHVGTGDQTSALLKHASSVFEQAIEHETYPFARVASKYGFTPQVSYTCQLGVLDSLTIQEGEVVMHGLELDTAKIPMAIYVKGSVEGELRIDVDYDSSLYTDTMAQHFAESIANVAAAMTAAEKLSQISLTTEKDWAQLDTFNSPLFTDYDHSDTVVSLFRKQVERHPDKTAAVYADKRYTYRELDEATDRLAAYLYNKLTAITGKRELREEVVSIIIDRNEWVFLLPLAVLKTGCAYEPLDPSYPSDRLNYMVQDAKACLLLGQPEFVGLVNEYKGDVVLTEELAEVLKSPLPREGWGGAPSPGDLLLMLYTSGSTGKPKGVQIEHHSLVSYAHGIAKADFYTEDRVVAAYASFGFDVCMSDTFCTLLNGGTLVVIPESLRLELKLLADYLDSEKVSQIFMTTQVGVQFLQNYPNMKYLHCLGMGGEKLPAVSPEGLSYEIINGYGPTENTCGVSLFPVKHWEPNIPLGRPFPTIQGYVLDKAGHRLPPGACGEYCVAGDQPARGYLGLPEKTAEVFVEYKGLRMYHTGDVVRYRENGDVEFVGRKDGMVKIRGFRIELKEVEAAIRPFPGIKDVTVQAYDYDGGGKYLAAFVVSEKTVNIEALLTFVKNQKPPYMVPAIVMQIDSIPLTVNQKVDKKALPKPHLAAAAYVPPANKVEEDFCAIFGEVLGVEKYSAASDFFEMGGSSIIALKVVIAAEKHGYTIVYNDVFSYPTPQTMAEHQTSPSPSQGGEPIDTKQNGNDDITEHSTVSSPWGRSGEVSEIAPDGYDYRAINQLLRGNTMEAFKNGEMQPIGDVLLTGATGYLGIHVLKDLIDNYTGRIYCFVRGKKTISGERRLKNLLYYYFENSYNELFGTRIFVIEGDATNPADFEQLTEVYNSSLPRGGQGWVVINCAACVKHFSKGNEIEQINVGSVRNLIAWCLKTGSRLVHVSTGSVAGGTVDNFPPREILFDEHMLYIGQQTEYNQYIHSKFLAERYIYEAILQQGLNAKVMRVGNLAPRDKDGEFQVNFKSNNFMASLNAFNALGMIPYSQMDSHFEFSPIDKVARAIMTLAVTPRECVCFMPSNQHRPHLGDVVMQLAEVANTVQMVEDDVFQAAIGQALSDPAKVDKMRPFMVYATGNTQKTIHSRDYDEISVDFTAQVLYRLGFRWPTTTEDYVRRFLKTLSGLNFFD